MSKVKVADDMKEPKPLVVAKVLRRKFSIQQIIASAQSLGVLVNDDPPSITDFERGICVLIARVLLDDGGIGEGTDENAVLIAEYMRHNPNKNYWIENPRYPSK